MGNNELCIHRLVQDVVREKMEPEELKLVVEATGVLLTSVGHSSAVLTPPEIRPGAGRFARSMPRI